MSISELDIKLLWGRAAGICSNPQCQKDLTIMLEHGGTGYIIGEMAHVIAKKPLGPRGRAEGGSDSYQNLLLLCPSCHRMIDKAPEGEFPEDMLFQWKTSHEDRIRTLGKQVIFAARCDLWVAIRRLLTENRILWRDLGPQSLAARTDPGSNLYMQWNLRKLDTVIPNNTKIINYIESNEEYLEHEEFELFVVFKGHAKAFEAHQYNRLDVYPQFPPEFGRIFDQ
jgi:HNH endonuclease